MTTRATRTRRPLTVAIVVAIALVGMGTADLVNAAPVSAAAANPASNDWFFENYGDALDFNNVEDFDTTPGYQAITGSASLVGGQLQLVGASQVYFLRGQPGSFPMAVHHDARARWLDAGRYNHLAFRMWSNVSGGSAFGYNNCFAAGCADGLRYFQIQAGWHDYDLNMNGPGPDDRPGFPPTSGTPWSGYIHNLYLLPGSNPAAEPSLTFEDFRIIHPGNTSTIPMPRVLTPTEMSGTDWVTDATGDPWDFESTNDVSRTTNITFSTFFGEGHGGTAGPTPNDPSISLNLHGRTIDATTYHTAEFSIRYDGGWSLADAPGGGMNARILWHVVGQPPGAYQISDDLVVTPGKSTYVVDLKTSPPNTILDPAGNPNPLGWGAGGSTQIDELRFDPHEDRGSRTWHIDDFHLMRNQNANPGTAIRWIDDSWTAGTRAKIYVDNDRAPQNGQTLIADVATNAGENTFNWNSAGVPNGAYWVRVVETNAQGGEGIGYSTGQVDVGAGPGITPAAFDWAALIAFINALNWAKFVAFVKAIQASKAKKSRRRVVRRRR